MNVAKSTFDRLIADADEAVAIFDHLSKGVYKAEFSLRSVWVYSASSLDMFVTDFILERALHQYSTAAPLTEHLLKQESSIRRLVEYATANPVDKAIIFREMLVDRLRYRTFQMSGDIADGLALVWSEKDKWKKLASSMGEQNGVAARRKLDRIIARRNLIVHNMDFDYSSRQRLAVDRTQAVSVIDFTKRLAGAIDFLA